MPAVLRKLHSIILESKVFQIAAEATQNLVTGEIWFEICEEIDYEIDGLSEMPDPFESLNDAVDLMFDIVSESIVRVDFEVHSVFTMIYVASISRGSIIWG